MFFKYACLPNKDKLNVKLEETFCNKYLLVVIDVFVLVKDRCFIIDVPAFLWGKNKFYGTTELSVSPRLSGDKMWSKMLLLK